MGISCTIDDSFFQQLITWMGFYFPLKSWIYIVGWCYNITLQSDHVDKQLRSTQGLQPSFMPAAVWPCWQFVSIMYTDVTVWKIAELPSVCVHIRNGEKRCIIIGRCNSIVSFSSTQLWKQQWEEFILYHYIFVIPFYNARQL